MADPPDLFQRYWLKKEKVDPMKGLDLRNFKKVGEDVNSATLKHPKGHEIKIAKGSLSPTLKEQLSQLPSMMAKGGEVNKYAFGSDEPVSSSEKDSLEQIQSDAGKQSGHAPINININASPAPANKGEALAQEAMNSPAKTSYSTDQNQFYSGKEHAWIQYPKELLPQKQEPVTTRPETMMPSDVQPAPSPGLSQAPEAPQNIPTAPMSPLPNAQPEPVTPQAPAPAPPAAAPTPEQSPYDLHKQAVMQDMNAEDQAWQHDLQNGHITPKTYAGLFGKKDTLGEIGTIFGMLIGGGGSALAKQPNMLLSMMNKKIDDDLQAQMQSKTNAQNFLKINQSAQMNKAQIGAISSENALRAAQITGIGAENALREAQVTGIGSENQVRRAQVGRMGQENNLTQAQVRVTNAETNARSYALSRMQMNVAALHSLAQAINKMPLGSPQRQQAEQSLAMMNSAVQNENYSIADRAASASAYARMLFGDQPGVAPGSEQQFQRYTSNLKMLGPQGEVRAKDMEEKHIPGVQGQASISPSPKDRDDLKHLNNFGKGLSDAQEYLNKAGTLGFPFTSGARAQGVALSKRLELEIGNLEGLGRFTPEEAKRYKDMIPDLAGTHFTDKDQAKLNSIMKEVKEHRDTILQGSGIMSPQQDTSSEPASQYKVVNGIRYMRGPKGEAVPVQ